MAGFCYKLYEIRLRILSNTRKINDGVRQIKIMGVPYHTVENNQF
jgi:hypothetical protein